MKRIIFTIAVLAGLLLQGNSQSLLWKIYGKGLRDTSYLYGTIHIQDKRVFRFDSIVYDKLNAVEAYAMELNPEKIDMEAMKKQMLMKKHSLNELLSDSDYQCLDNYMKEKMGTGVLLYNKMKPFFLQSQLSQLSMPKDMDKALDLFFFDYAKKHEKITLGIEKLEDQLSAIKAISLQDQAKMLMQTVRDTTDTDFDELLDAYLHADFDKFAELMKDTTLPSNFEEALLTKRNKGMAKHIIEYCKKQPTFNAIGAAHLPGPNGVIALLRKKGYKVEPIPFKFKDN
jgi:uncharacterized protein YbaP (TraB family)